MKILNEDEMNEVIFNVGVGTIDRFSTAELVSAILLIKESTIEAYDNVVGLPDKEKKFLNNIKTGIQRMYDQIIEKLEE